MSTTTISKVKLSILLLLLLFCASCNSKKAALPAKHIPQIKGQWQLLYRPDPNTVGHYINDHTLFQHTDGTWHLIGITSPKLPANPEEELYLAHGIGKQLIEPDGYIDAPIIADHGEKAWAPHAVWHNDLLYLFYSPVSMRLITSEDTKTWTKPQVLFEHSWGDPKAVPFQPSDPFRDAMVLKVDENKWLMYATRLVTTDQPKNYSAVGLYESTDLVNWKDIGFALTTSGNAPYNLPYSSCESPFVMKYGDWYYLAFTYVDYEHNFVASYENTIVFRSLHPNDPYHFGDYNGDESMIIARLKSHAPEFVVNPDDGKWYITTCGWLGCPNPKPGAVSIAELQWAEQSVPETN